MCQTTRRLAVIGCILDRKPLPEMQAMMWREAPNDIKATYERCMDNGMDDLEYSIDGRHGLLAEKMKDLRRPLLSRPRKGVTITQMAKDAGIARETLANALEHHGYVELVPYGGPNRRRLVTRTAERAGLGHNPDGSRQHVAHLEGLNRASVFAVFYSEHIKAILWTLDLTGIGHAADAILKKRGKLTWLLANHDYLPNQAIAQFARCAERSVERARGRVTPNVGHTL